MSPENLDPEALRAAFNARGVSLEEAYTLYDDSGVIPLPTVGKRCLLKNWPTADVTIADFKNMKPDGIGLRCGKYGRGLVMLDFDHALAAFAFAKQNLRTLTIGRGGQVRKAVFLCIDEAGEHRSATHDGKTIVELLATGKQAIVPPSVWVSPSDPFDTMPVEVIDDAPIVWLGWRDLVLLHDAIAEDVLAQLGGDYKPAPVRKRVASTYVAKPIDPLFQAYNVDDSETIQDIIKRNGFRFLKKKQGPNGPCEEWIRAGKDKHDRQKSCTVGYAKDSLWFFSTSVDGFDVNIPYKKHEVRTIMEYAGNESAFKKVLATKQAASNVASIDEYRKAKEDPYPIEELPLCIREAVIHSVSGDERIMSLAAVSALAVCSAAAQGLAQVQVPKYGPDNISIWFLGTAETGTGKTRASKLFLDMYDDYAIEWTHKNHQAVSDAMLDDKEIKINRLKTQHKHTRDDMEASAILEQIKKINAEQKKWLPIPQRSFQGFTIESLRKKLHDSYSSLLIADTDGGSTFGGYSADQKRVMATLSALNDLYSGTSSNHTSLSGGDIFFRDASLTSFILTHRRTLKKFFDAGGDIAADNGFMQRFLYLDLDDIPADKLVLSRSYDEQSSDPFLTLPDRIMRLMDLAHTAIVKKERKVLRLSEAALDVWADAVEYMHRLTSDGGELAGLEKYVVRTQQHIARLAAVLTLVECPTATEVSVDATARAVTIVQWHFRQLAKFLGGVHESKEDENARKVYERIHKTGKDGITEARLKNNFRTMNAVEISLIIKSLTELEKIRSQKTDKTTKYYAI